MTDNTIHIIGLGVAETAELTASANQALTNANIVIGAERQLAVVNQQLKSTQQRIVLPKLAELTTIIQNNIDQSIAVLASGDPLYFGIGRWFSKRFEAARLQFHPAVSSIQAACHRLGVALQDVNVISLHGRPLASLRTQLKRQQRLLILTDQHSQPQRLAQECLAAGFNDSTITVCENLGYQK
ncbi:MAG: precorrin-6y C5,15-methyltransferase (decarboxylating) subunit CbiE, partial [Gammaproteobacteria bacterium]|nr:precorrin-6y C5,15-methyltransferase (decarboxylating) subunit CbiE [Gammaproteobacteria bacterium]